MIAKPAARRRSRCTRALLCLLVLAGGARAAEAPLSADDLTWLRRASFGLDSATVQRYRELGRTRFLDESLAGGDDPLPPAVAPLIESYPVYHANPADLALQFRNLQEQAKNAKSNDPSAAEQTRKQVQAFRRDIYRQSVQIELLRAIYAQNQLKERMVWFWLNHFSIYAAKGAVGLYSEDFEEHAIRPYALGKFRDLVMATLKSPAMQLYLDNARNIKGQTNENYARELMELHTLGVHAGYSQQDVQQLALILTGAGLVPPRLMENGLPRLRPGAVHEGEFLFAPMRHDYSDKQFLGQRIKGDGYNEIAQAVDLIVRQPACARFISQQIAQYFVSDQPSPALVDRMSDTFQRTDGDIAAVLRTMFLSPELAQAGTPKFQDPTEFLIAAMRMSYDGKPISNADPLTAWLNQMNEPLYGRITPDGWPLDSASWSGSGQMAKRFDVARIIGSGKNRLFSTDDGNPVRGVPPALNSPLFAQTLAPRLSAATRDALGKANSPMEWNTFLLSSPEFNYR